jgi:hypothetical protein
MRVWDAHAAALEAADAATNFQHPLIKVFCIARIIYPLVAPLFSHLWGKNKQTYTQACHLHQCKLTRAQAAVIAVGLGHALVGILRRLSKVSESVSGKGPGLLACLLAFRCLGPNPRLLPPTRPHRANSPGRGACQT